MGKKLLTLNDLVSFYSNKKRSFHFSASEDEAIFVQVPGMIRFSEDEYDPTLGLLPVHLKTCHIDDNRNGSTIPQSSMEQAIPSIYNRPILGFIHKLSDGSYDFAGHEMYINDNGEIEYEEIACGTIPESCDPQLIYDQEQDKTYLEVDGYIYEEYTKAADILKEKQEKKVSVELALLDFSFDAKTKKIIINKFYFSGVTILGVTRDGKEKPIEEGMLGSKVKLKDFSESNNSVFSKIDENDTKLIDTLERLNETLSKFNINKDCGKEDEEKVEETINLNEESAEAEEVATEEVTETMSDEELDKETPEVVDSDVNTDIEDDEVNEENDENEVSESSEDPEDIKEDEERKKKKCSLTRTYELSHEDIRYGLYEILNKYEEADDDYYWIMAVYESFFVYQSSNTGQYYKQAYKVDENNISFEGNRIEVFTEFVTADEKAELDSMRANYSSILSELNIYKENESIADKMTVFNDKSYEQYLDTNEFKDLMNVENVKKFTKEELVVKAELCFAKLVKSNNSLFSNEVKTESKNPSFFAFAKSDKGSSFLDGLLKK